MVKNGLTVKRQQRFKCNKCGKSFTTTTVGEKPPYDLLAGFLYSQGWRPAHIAQALRLSRPTVMRWLRGLSNLKKPLTLRSKKDKVLTVKNITITRN